jgi:hypothetical protein
MKQMKDSGRRLVFSKLLIDWGNYHQTLFHLPQTRLLILLVTLASVPFVKVLTSFPLTQTPFLVYLTRYRRYNTIPLGVTRVSKTEEVASMVTVARQIAILYLNGNTTDNGSPIRF